jgi:hypothetical protein
MQNKLIYYSVIFAGLLFLGSACEKNFLDINNNPNAPAQADPALVFTNALTQTAYIVSVDYLYMNGTQNYYGNSVRAAPPGPNNSVNFTSTDFVTSWTDNYHNLNDYAFIEKSGTETNKWFLVGAAKIMKSLNFQMLVDTYGDVPYTEALRLSKNILTPKYDKAQDIYNACIQQLDSAVDILENTVLVSTYNPGNADVMFKGDATMWIKFANTLKLRMLLHEIGVSSQQSTIQAEMQKIANDPIGLLGPGESAMVNPGYATDAAAHLNPLYSHIGYSITGAVALVGAAGNSYFINKLDGYNDTRLGYFYGTNVAGMIEGNPLGAGGNSAASYFGGPVNKLNANNNLPFNFKPPLGFAGTIPKTWGILPSPTTASIILSSWESLFLQAEAVQRGLLPGNADDLYAEAITDNFIYLNVFTDGTTFNSNPAVWAAAYLSQNIANVGWQASSANPLQAILIQKYISLCITDPLESWTDYRRTGYPKDLPFSASSSRLYDYPYRFIYPQSEYNTNSKNVAAEGAINPISPKIFWMP